MGGWVDGQTEGQMDRCRYYTGRIKNPRLSGFRQWISISDVSYVSGPGEGRKTNAVRTPGMEGRDYSQEAVEMTTKADSHHYRDDCPTGATGWDWMEGGGGERKGLYHPLWWAGIDRHHRAWRVLNKFQASRLLTKTQVCRHCFRRRNKRSENILT